MEPTRLFLRSPRRSGCESSDVLQDLVTIQVIELHFVRLTAAMPPDVRKACGLRESPQSGLCPGVRA